MKFHKKLFLIPIILFIIGANYAWLNPHPEYQVYKTLDFPFFWQFNPDSGVEIVSAAYFPDAFKMYKDRINRPTYPLLVNSIATFIKLIIKPFYDVSSLEAAGGGYIILKLLIFFLASLALYNIFHFYLNDTLLSFFGLILIFFHPFSIEAFSTFHTFELQFINPIIFSFFFLILTKNYSHKKNIFFSIIVGILLLGRQNYAIYLSFLTFSILNKHYFSVIVSFLSHLLPLGLYYIFLDLYNITYVNHEIENYNQGIFILNYIKDFQFEQLFIELGTSLFFFIKSIFSYFYIVILFILLGHKNLKVTKIHLIYLSTILFFTHIQFLAARKYDIAYMVSDMSIFIVGIGLYAIRNNSFFILNKNIIASAYFLISIFTLINLPLKNPYEFDFRSQKVLNQRKNMIENPEKYSDIDRKNARNGVLIKEE
jgi:hypothetical protein